MGQLLTLLNNHDLIGLRVAGVGFAGKFMNQGGALVHIYMDGTVLVTTGGIEMGQGLHTKCCMVC